MSTNDGDFASEQENDGNDDYHHSREHVAICAAQSSTTAWSATFFILKLDEGELSFAY